MGGQARVMIWVGAAATATVGVTASLAYAVRGRSSGWLAPSVHHGPTDRRTLALTFDDGPTPSTPKLLELLARHNVSATFFQCGAQVRRYPEIAREVLAAGHEIGNHTDTHPMLAMKPPDFIRHELAMAQDTIATATGHSPLLFRAPYGVRWFGLRRAQSEFSLLGVMWTCIGLDWKESAPAVADRIVRGASNGAIFCLHDGRELAPKPDVSNTIEAVRQALPRLLEQGYRLERVSDLLCTMT